DDLTIAEAMPASDVVIQGEIRRSDRYVDLYYSTEPLHMRPALAKSPRYAFGLAALSLLRSAMDPASSDDLDLLLERYDDAAIELTVLRRCFGIVPHRNTIFWEVRNY